MKVKTKIVIEIEDANDLTERELDIMENALIDLQNLSKKTKDEEEMSNPTNLGRAHLKTEGAHIHPDDPIHGYGGDDDQRYKRQLEGYCEDNNLDLEFETAHCLRPELWNTDGEDIDAAEYSMRPDR